MSSPTSTSSSPALSGQMPRSHRGGSASSSRRTPTTSSDPRSSSSTWSVKDDQTLIEARAKGRNWGPIAEEFFPTKTANACRKRHERLMERRRDDDWDYATWQKLATEYVARRPEIWGDLAAAMGSKWSVVEAKCMEKGVKNLINIARNAQKSPLQIPLPNDPSLAPSSLGMRSSYSTHATHLGSAGPDSGIGGSDAELDTMTDSTSASAAASTSAAGHAQQPHQHQRQLPHGPPPPSSLPQGGSTSSSRPSISPHLPPPMTAGLSPAHSPALSSARAYDNGGGSTIYLEPIQPSTTRSGSSSSYSQLQTGLPGIASILPPQEQHHRHGHRGRNNSPWPASSMA